MRRLIDIRPDDSILDIVFETTCLCLFCLVALVMCCAIVGLIVFALVSLTQAAVG